MKESHIQKAILEYLAARHIFALRMQTGASISEYGGKKRMIRYGVAGCADILAFPRFGLLSGNLRNDGLSGGIPEPVWLEVKSDTGKQSELQRSFQEQVEREGHRYFVVRSIDDVIEALR
jgi:hypothetical protein